MTTSGDIHRSEPLNPPAVDVSQPNVSVADQATELIPRSASRATSLSSIKMFALKAWGECWQTKIAKAYPFNISMIKTHRMNVLHASGNT
jgi:hypothetical protein